MKRIFQVLLVLMLGIVLVSCKKDEDDRTVISYAAWNLGSETENNIERRMIKAFEELNPEVRVDIIERPRIIDEDGNEIDGSWDAFFNAQAAIKKMPDVFQVDNVVKAIMNDWVSDVSAHVLDDADFNNIPIDIRESAKYGDQLFALPQAMFYMGYFINRTVIDQKSPAGAITPTYGMSYDDLMEAAKKNAKEPVSGGDGIVGIDGVNNLFSWLSAQQDENFDWFTFTEDEGYHLDSEGFKYAMNEQQKYFGAQASQYASYVLESTNEMFIQTEQDFWNPEVRFGAGSPFESGSQAIKWEGSYNLRNWLGATKDPESALPGLFGADIDFIGTPSVEIDGVVNHKIPVILDYIGVGQGTKEPELAYEFAKWMGFGVDGYKQRLKIARETPKAGAVNFAPIVQDQALMNEYFELYPTLVEFKKIVTSHDSFIIESLAKTVPGYIDSRWEGKYSEEQTIGQLLDEIRDGKVNLDDVATNLNILINQIYTDAKLQLENALKANKG